MVPTHFIQTNFLKLQNQEKLLQYRQYPDNKNICVVACLEEYVNRTELIRKNLEANNEEFIQFMPIRISLTIPKK